MDNFNNYFVSIPILFAGRYPAILSTHSEHLSLRWEERVGETLSNIDCLQRIKIILEDSRMKIMFDKVSLYSQICLFVEEQRLYLFFQIGTALNPQEIKVSTVKLRRSPRDRALVETEDFCYFLPETGPLRFGKENKYFKIKPIKKEPR